MNRAKLAWALLLAAGMLSACSNPLGSNPFTQAPVLEFPLAAPDDVERLAAFNTPNWSGSEPHNGIDLVLASGVDRTLVLAPCAGTVQAIEITENTYSNPPGQIMVSVFIFVNPDWQIKLVYEPSTVDPGLKDAQRNAIRVQAGQKVRAGDAIGDLLAGTLGYPHLHYMVLHRHEAVCAYAWSSGHARTVFEAIAARSGSVICY